MLLMSVMLLLSMFLAACGNSGGTNTPAAEGDTPKTEQLRQRKKRRMKPLRFRFACSRPSEELTQLAKPSRPRWMNSRKSIQT